MQQEDTLNDVVKKAYNLFKKQYVALIVGTLVGILCMIFIVTIPPLAFGIYYMCVQLVKGKKIEYTDVFKGFRYFFRSWIMFIAGILAVAAGLILFIVPGLLLIVFFQYALAISILEDRGAISSLKRSYRIGRDNAPFSVVFWLLMGAINSIVSATALGILVTVPFTALCAVLAAQKLGGLGKKK